LIPKVNTPPLLSVVPETRAPENDPGSSQGSGLAYEAPGDAPSEANPPEAQVQETAPPSGSAAPGLRLVPPRDRVGMTDVVRSFHEHRKARGARSGLGQKYASATGGAKGLLLNRKAE
jgi:hypothetical protein